MSQQQIATLDFDINPTATELNNRVAEIFEAISSGEAAKVFDASKNLLESVFRTIIVDKKGAVEEGARAATFPNLYNQAKDCIRMSEEPEVIGRIDEICEKAVLVIGQLRNRYGFGSHGRDGFDNSKVGLKEALFVARVALGIANLFYGKHLDSPLKHMNERLIYEEFEEFNDHIDTIQSDEFIVAGIAIRPSEALFKTDSIAYKEALIEYMESIHD